MPEFAGVEDALSWVGAPREVFRVVDAVYLDEARHDFAVYLQRTLAGSQRVGGRFNPPNEFGALYTTEDEDTAWSEVARRFKRNGVDGLPPEMGVLRLVIRAARYADLMTEVGARAWDVTLADLTASDPNAAQRETCWRVARAVRAIADGLLTQSAHARGANMPLFPDREDPELVLELGSAIRRGVPVNLRQQARESW